MNSNRAQISLPHAILIWLGAWIVGSIAASIVLVASGHDSVADAGHGWLVAISVAQWVPMVAALWAAGRRFGVGKIAADYGLSFRPIDLVGVPIAAATQFLLIPLLYVPLRSIWPGTFSTEHVERRARDLFAHPSGVGLVLLIAAVAVGAPLVEELVYRGLLQGAFGRRLQQWRGWLAVVLVAALFALVHFQPVEYPGLFLIGLVLGACALLTGRLGMGVLAHAAFNAAALVLVATS
jgi:uncharacterized protein